ncbi:MAG: hypothetical protein M1834_001562 [Cirrosporium novae-zelandiae]|nr:MAG: hypothetical protein M1834_004079 [Cirrosporium novae-zelandiae]KAI9735547.1 MAG: hypothetical protein M1834_001562 [Cirrosporium novae-zelandiae]
MTEKKGDASPPQKKADFPPVRACLFDMDGLLIDSEDIYTLVTNIILREHGRPDLPWHIKAQLQGRPGPEASKIFHTWAQLPLDLSEYNSRLAYLQQQHFPSTAPLPGVPSLLQTLSTSPSKVNLALATSSHAKNFTLKTTHLQDLFSVFQGEQRVLGDDPRVERGRGKPCPDIYLLALETINAPIRRRNATRKEKNQGEELEKEVSPHECLVFEDSVPGVEAGRRAGMRVIWCPHPGLRKEYAGREREVLTGTSTPSSKEAMEAVNALNEDALKGIKDVSIDDVLKAQTAGTNETLKSWSGNVTPGGGSATLKSFAAGLGDGSSGTGMETPRPDVSEEEIEKAIDGTISALDDGWAELLDTLGDFNYTKYGIAVPTCADVKQKS